MKSILKYHASGFVAIPILALFKAFFYLRVNSWACVLARIIMKLMSVSIEDLLEIRYDFDPLLGRLVNRAILDLPSFGCTYYFKSGGCHMCGFNREIEKFGLRELHPRAIIVLVYAALFLFEEVISEQLKKIDVLMVFMAGSFINREELPVGAQNAVIAFVKRNFITKLFIETRAEYVSQYQERLQEIISRLDGCQLEVAIGLEAVNNRIRNNYIGKGLNLFEYRKALGLLKAFDCYANTYVLIGSPFLSREIIIDEAIKTAYFAWRSGSDMVSFESYSVQTGSIWAKLFQEGRLLVPTLWDIVEVLKQVDQYSPNWYLGKFSDKPEPIKKPQNCPNCHDRVAAILDEVRKNHDLGILSNLLDCNCRITHEEKEEVHYEKQFTH